MTAHTDHPSPEQLSQYVDRALAPEGAAACARHVATCDSCHAATEELRQAGWVIRRAAPAPPLDAPCPGTGVWAAFVGDGRTPDLERHLAGCANCRAVLAAGRLVPAPAVREAGPPRSALVCFRCRAALSEQDQFCPQCGAQITARTGLTGVVREGPGAWFTHLWLAISLAALVTSFFWGQRFYQCLVISLGSFLFWLHLRNPVRQYLDILTSLGRGDTKRADALLENLKRRLGAHRH